jgi:hypothetical protein
MASIVFDSKYEVYTYLLVFSTRSVAFTSVNEGTVFIDLVELLCSGVCPERVAVLGIQFQSLIMVPGHKLSVHVYGFGSERMQFCLVGKP